MAYLGFARRDPALFRLMFSAGDKQDDDALGKAVDSIFVVLCDRIAGFVPPARLEIATLSAWSMMHGLANLIIDGKISAPDPDALIRSVLVQFAMDAAQLR